MKITYQEFKERQNWNLYQKIDHAVGTMERFLSETNGRAFISFSGGKDSTVLLDIARRFIDRKFLGVFSNTGNEYPETVKFVRSFDNLTIIHPQMRVKEVLAKYGFPLISKEQSQYIRQARNTKSGNAYIDREFRNKRDVWTVPTQPLQEAHFATFPEKLVADCILAGCPENGIVLDPFMGSGTTGIVARKFNRKYIGFELNPEYIEIADKRLKKELGLFI